MKSERIIAEEDVALVWDEVQKGLLRKRGFRTASAGEYKLEWAAFSVLVGQIVLPIIVSLSGRALYDILKGKTPGALTKEELEEVLRRLKGSQLVLDKPPSQDCLTELNSQLSPMGFSESETHELVESVRKRLVERNTQRTE